MTSRLPPWKTSPARRDLLALYAKADALLAQFSCEQSTECCRFGVTGREPYVTSVEIAEIEHAIAARGGAAKGTPTAKGRRGGRALPLVEDERRCPLLDDGGKCTIYASRPLGCRTFFCDRARGPGKLPRAEAQAVARDVATLAASYAPRNPHARPLTRALSVSGRTTP